MPHVCIVRLFLPLDQVDGTPHPQAQFRQVQAEMIQRCGGVTMFSRAPAEGLWEQNEIIEQDRIVLFEAIDKAFDGAWWRTYREQLEQRFAQERILILAADAITI